MRRLVSSRGYSRAKTANGVVFILFGIAMLAEAFSRIATAGPRIIPLVALGGVMAALGIVRVRGSVKKIRS